MTKEKERAELHKSIWQIANHLRGSIDGWDFKQYILCRIGVFRKSFNFFLKKGKIGYNKDIIFNLKKYDFSRNSKLSIKVRKRI